MEKKDIRMIASDIDGTLLRSDGSVSERNVRAVRQAQEQGVVFSLCTGRFAENAGALMRVFGLQGEVIATNGCMLWDARRDVYLAEHDLPAEAARAANEILEKYSCMYYVFGRKRMTTNRAGFIHPACRQFGSLITDELGVCFESGPEAIREALALPVQKFFIYGFQSPQARSEAWQKLEKIPGVEITSSGENNIEVIPYGVNKALGIAQMAALHGLKAEQVMAIGDYENDVPMLRAAGWGVAMGNAPERVRREADAVTDTNDEDGFARAIEKYVLKEAR